MHRNSPTSLLLDHAQLIRQGAEAKVYKCFLHPPSSPDPSLKAEWQQLSQPILLKHRFQKHYRHPSLDASLTKTRVSSEARALIKCVRSGVNVPGVRMVDAAEGVLGIEWIEGHSIRVLLGASDELNSSETADGQEEPSCPSDSSPIDIGTVTHSEIMTLMGIEIAKMHLADVIHGDLTTSNMMLRQHTRLSNSGDNGDAKLTYSDLVLIDFGLSYTSSLAEDKAVDLYVLERAFTSTHPNSESLFQAVLLAYAERSGKNWKAVERKLDEVRLRGRKRSMVG